MKKLTYISALVMLLIFYINIGAFAFTFDDTAAKDIDSHWAEEYIETLKAMDVMNGYMGYTRPNDFITRGEFATILVRGFGFISTKDEQKFIDIEKGHIFFESINAACEAGIIDGYHDNTFQSEKSVTREEIVLMLSRITEKAGKTKKVNFTDIGSEYRYTSELNKIVNDEIVSGYPDQSFRPYHTATRAEAAKMIVKAMEKYLPEPTENEVEKTVKQFMTELFENKHTKATGSALIDAEYIMHTYNKAKELGYALKNEIENINIEEINVKGGVVKVTITYDTRTKLGANEKLQKNKSTLKLITVNGVTNVFEHDRDIKKDGAINLTWEVFSNPKNVSTPGVNVVSPTSFVISKGSENKKNDSRTENGTVLNFSSTLNEEYVRYAKTNNFDIWAMYKTDFDPNTATEFLKSESARKQFSEKLLEYMLLFALDGINFDFENMYHIDKSAYTNHVREITLMAHTIGAIVSVDITRYEPTSLNWSMCYDRDKLGSIADYVVLMAYDQYYAGSKDAGPVSGIGWTEESIKLSLDEISSEKLILGMPYYIRCWKVKNGSVVSSEAISMEKALEYIKINKATGKYDELHKLTKYTWAINDEEYVLWLENAESIRERVKLSKKYDLAGVASWRRGFETPDVWDVIKTELGI